MEGVFYEVAIASHLADEIIVRKFEMSADFYKPIIVSRTKINA